MTANLILNDRFTEKEGNLIALDYYDGPMSGALRCSGGKDYGFVVLDWSPKHRWRLLALFTLRPSEYDNLADLIAGAISSTSDAGGIKFELMKKIARPRIQPDHLALWDNSTYRMISTLTAPNGLSDEVWGAWLDAEETMDWFTYLGISPTSEIVE